MQTHIFCSECGHKNEFSNGRRPNFCSGCGCDLRSLASFGGTPKPAPRPTVADVEITNEPTTGRGSTGGTGFSRADVEIDSATIRDAKVKLGSFASVPPAEVNGARHALDAKAKRVNAKKVLQQFKDEAGSKPAVMQDSVPTGNDNT